MNILFASLLYDYGIKSRGFSFEFYNFYDSLKKMNNSENNVYHLPIDNINNDDEKVILNQKLITICKEKKIDLVFFFLFKDEFYTDVLIDIKKKYSIPTIAWMADDHWRFENYSKYISPNFSYVITTDKQSLKKYEKNGLYNVIKSQWGVNNFLYKRINNPKIKYDVSFVGQPHGNRRQRIEKIKSIFPNTICFGSGWDNNRIEQDDLVNLFNNSAVNLNFSESSFTFDLRSMIKIFFSKNSSNKIKINSILKIKKNILNIKNLKRKQIKARVFEIVGSGGFLLTEYAENLEDYFDLEKEICTFQSDQELKDKLKFYKYRSKERNEILEKGYNRAINDHTYEKRFNLIFSKVFK